MPDFKSHDGARIFYSDEGEGRPVLALAGLTRNGSDFDYMAPHLPDIRLIRMDYRGRGKSEWTGAETYTIPTEAQDVLALMDHLALESMPIIGTSRGGLIAMVLAATVKDRLSGVCLVDIGPELPEAAMQNIRDYTGRDPAASSFDEAATLRASLLPGFRNVPRERWLAEAQKHYELREGRLRINYDPALGEAVRAPAPSADLWPLFLSLDGLPVALIRGENSDLLTRSLAEDMRRRFPNLIFTEVPDRGHVPFLDEPEALNCLRDWLGRLP